MSVSFNDLVAGKLLVQLGWRAAGDVARELQALDRDFSARGYVDWLVRSGTLDEERAHRLHAFVVRYDRVRREALYVGLIERAKLLPPDELERWKDRLDEIGYAQPLSFLLKQEGRLTEALDAGVQHQQALGLERESERLLATYRRTGFQGVDRPITKDPKARVDETAFTIRKLFRSAESQRLAKQAMLLAGTSPPPVRPVSDDATEGKTGATFRYLKPAEPLPVPDERGTKRFEPLAFERTATFDAAAAQKAVAAAEAAGLPKAVPATAPTRLEVDTTRARVAAGQDAFAGTVLEEGPQGAPRPDGLPSRIQDLDVEGILGAGGMGIVCRAKRAATGEVFAVKLARSRQGEVVERFRREALATSLIQHDNVVRAFGSGSLPDGTPFMVLELVQGRELRDLLREKGVLHPREALSVMVQVLAALEAAHEKGVVHRDVKPENVLVVDVQGRLAAKLMDFGLARIEQDAVPDGEEVFKTMTTDVVSGSPPYLAPEQIMGGKVDQRTDLYALGVVLFEMVTGRLPFVASSLSGYVRAHVQKQAPALSEARPGFEYGAPLEKLVASLLAKESEKRPPTAAAVLEAIERDVIPAFAPSSSGTGSQDDALAATLDAPPPVIALPARETRGITRTLARLWRRASGKDEKP